MCDDENIQKSKSAVLFTIATIVDGVKLSPDIVRGAPLTVPPVALVPVKLDDPDVAFPVA